MESRDVVRHAVELVPEFRPARRLHGRVPRRAHRENGRARRTPQVRQAGKAGKAGASYARRERRGRIVKVLLVDLETEWRGGQNPALLLLKGLRARGHSAELGAPVGSALQQRARAAGIPVPAGSRPFRGGRAGGQLRRRSQRLDCSLVPTDKGQEWLIRALAELRKKSRSARLLLAGDGPCRERLQRLAEKAGIADAVIFAGFIPDVESVYAAMDVFLLPSFFEALSNALMSAMACAIPSIAFNLGGPAEIIEDGTSGLLVEPANVEALCAAIAKVLSNANFAESLGEKGRQRIEQEFSADKMVDGIIDVYDAISARAPQ